MGLIFKDGVRYGGFFTGPAQDIFFDHRETICSSANVQGAIKNISDCFDKNHGVSSTPIKEACTIATTDNTHLVSYPEISSVGTPNIAIDDDEIGSILLSKADSDAYIVKKIQVGLNPTTNNLSLIITWFDGSTEQRNYIDFTTE